MIAYRTRSPSAFSLVELSIVLVILGLLVGGIMSASSLIRASELRSISSDFTKYQTAIYAFRDKYFYLPGDLPNATSLWGDQATGTNACASAATADGTPGTCNGNGDGKVASPSTGGALEMWRAWQHLAMAGLIEGSYAGTQSSWGTNALPGVDFPASKISSAGYMFLQHNNTNSEFNYTGLTYAYNMVIFGASTVTVPVGSVLTPTEAWNLDTKMDDGLPASGKVWGGKPVSGCATTSVSTTAAYAISSTNSTCVLGLIIN